jgi:hypothetical protein
MFPRNFNPMLKTKTTTSKRKKEDRLIEQGDFDKRDSLSLYGPCQKGSFSVREVETTESLEHDPKICSC